LQQQPQMPDFNAKVAIPKANIMDTAPSSDDDRRLRGYYALVGAVPEQLVSILCDKLTDNFIIVPGPLLDPNLRATAVMAAVQTDIANAIEAHHQFIDDLREEKRKSDAAIAEGVSNALNS